MLRQILLTTVFCLPLVCGSYAFAQQDQTEETDMQATLGKMTGADPIQRALATQEALSSNNQILRSIALDTALASTDGVVKEQGLFYLANSQKQFIITVTLPPSDPNASDQSDSKTAAFENALMKYSPITIQVSAVDQNTMTIQGQANNRDIVGSITRDGLNFVISPGYVAVDGSGNFPCLINFRTVTNGLLVGAMTCNNKSYPATTAVP